MRAPDRPVLQRPCAVFFVGGGPGDADLLTLRAEALLAAAQVVVVDVALAHLARSFAPAADVVAVADEIAAPEVLLEAAGAGGAVVRLYRGDPWLHPAYEDERAALVRAGVACQAVAGVAAELGVPALAGVPVHVRQLAVACTLGVGGALPPAVDPARTLVATGDDPAALVRAVAVGGDPRLPAALLSMQDPAMAWRGPLGEALGAASSMAGRAVLVLGAVCKVPAVTGRPAVGPSGPAERRAQGPSGLAERRAPGPSGPAERRAQGPSGPAERERRGPTPVPAWGRKP